MANMDYQDHEAVVLDLVDDSVGANANAPRVPTGEFYGTGRPGRVVERADGFDEADPVGAFDLRECFLCRPFNV